MNNPLKVRFKIGEIEFEAEGSASDVERERESFKSTLLPLAIDAMVRTRGVVAETQYIEESEQPILLPAQGPIDVVLNSNLATTGLSTDLSKASLNEFLKTKGFKSQIDLAIGLIYYFEIGKRYSSFSRDELKGYFNSAKEKPPLNPSDVINRLVGKAYIMQASEKGRYQLTQTGIDFVEQFVAPAKSSKRTTSKTTRLKTVSAYADLNIDTLNLKNYPEIKVQDTFKKQMMLTLYIVNNEGHGDVFSVADVQCLMTDKLGLPATKGQIQGIFDRNTPWFTDVVDEGNKKNIRHKLLMGAKDFAESIISGT
ncbi:MAG: hypothetical protein KO254_01390 [Methanoculleus marisnigri]|nr:hypothetical protein [Methanoculleus marisnigri]